MRIARAELRQAQVWFGLGLLIAAAIVVGSLLPSRDLPDLGISDKFRHVCGYLLLSFWFGSIVARRRYPGLIVSLLAFGAAIELLQGWMGLGREADLEDMLANAIGIGIGMLLAITPLGLWVVRAEELLLRRSEA